MRESRFFSLGFGLPLVALIALGCSSHKPVTPDGKEGTGTASGTIGSRAFNSVTDARWIGAPDDPEGTRVIYVFEKPVSCEALSSAGWDQSITDGTQTIEMKLLGKTAGTYPVAGNGRPAAGEASVNYTVTSTSGTPAELIATGGSVTVDNFSEQSAANGSFDLMIPGGSVTGTFHATYCATGREP